MHASVTNIIPTRLEDQSSVLGCILLLKHLIYYIHMHIHSFVCSVL